MRAANPIAFARRLAESVKVDETTAASQSRRDGKVYRGAALIGATGLWSTIRQMIVGDGKRSPPPHHYRACCRQRPFRRNTAGRTWLSGREKVHLVLYPLRTGELFNLVAVFHSTATRKAGTVSAIRPSSTSVSPRPARRYARCCPRSELAHVGVVRPAGSRSEPRSHHAPRRWPRTRCCNIWRKAPACRSRTRCVSPTGGGGGRRLRRGVPRLSANALSAHRPRPDHARVYGEFYHASGVPRNCAT